MVAGWNVATTWSGFFGSTAIDGSFPRFSAGEMVTMRRPGIGGNGVCANAAPQSTKPTAIVQHSFSDISRLHGRRCSTAASAPRAKIGGAWANTVAENAKSATACILRAFAYNVPRIAPATRLALPKCTGRLYGKSGWVSPVWTAPKFCCSTRLDQEPKKGTEWGEQASGSSAPNRQRRGAADNYTRGNQCTLEIISLRTPDSPGTGSRGTRWSRHRFQNYCSAHSSWYLQRW